MSWKQKMLVLFTGAMLIGLSPLLATMYANYLFQPEVCWPDVYGYYMFYPVGFACMGACLWSLAWIEDRLEICGHKDNK